MIEGRCPVPAPEMLQAIDPFAEEAAGAGREGVVALPATCGELVQGTLDGVPCLVSCPIGWFGTARVRRLSPGYWEAPPAAAKASAALQMAWAVLGASGSGARLLLQGDIPRGRGYGSSTADVGATFYAAAGALGRILSAPQIAAGAVAIEPSDSTIFPGLVLFDHREGRFHESLGAAPSLAIVVIDPGGEVDTLAYNRQDMRAALRRLAAPHRDAFQWLREGLARGDLASVGAGATLSAQSHQAILPNPLLGRAIRLARDVRALGVCRTHSGSLIGILLDPSHSDVSHACRFVRNRIGDLAQVTEHRLVDGGPYYPEDGGDTRERPVTERHQPHRAPGSERAGCRT